MRPIILTNFHQDNFNYTANCRCQLPLLLSSYNFFTISLYKLYGFIEVEPYRYNPLEGAQYFELTIE